MLHGCGNESRGRRDSKCLFIPQIAIYSVCSSNGVNFSNNKFQAINCCLLFKAHLVPPKWAHNSIILGSLMMFSPRTIQSQRFMFYKTPQWAINILAKHSYLISPNHTVESQNWRLDIYGILQMCFGLGTNGCNLKAWAPILMKWKLPLWYMELYNLLFGNLCLVQTCLRYTSVWTFRCQLC